MSAVGVIFLLITLLGTLAGSRRTALLSLAGGVLYLPESQGINLLGFNCFALRFLELAAFFRVLSRSEFRFVQLTPVDRSVLWLYGYTTLVFVVRSADGTAYQIGIALDALLCYFAFRGLAGNQADVRWFLGAFLLLLVPYAVLLTVESVTHYNFFAAWEGASPTGWLREGRLRCEGSFRHPSLLGTLGASFLPLYLGWGAVRADRAKAAVGVAACGVVVWASNSGAPLSCVVVVLVGWCAWRWRRSMRSLRRGAALLLVALGFSMKAPIWYLLARISSLTGGDGYHRSYLIDVAVQHLGNWWLMGMPIQDTSDWFPYDLGATGGADITNEFLSFGIVAGLGGVALFINLIVRTYRRLGEALAQCRGSAARSSEEILLWGFGVMLAAHISNWLGITYFDQTSVVWFMQLAMIVNLTVPQVVQPVAAVRAELVDVSLSFTSSS